MPRLNTKITPSSFKREDVSIFLRKIIDEMFISYDTNFEVSYYKRELNEAAKKFFEECYVKLNTKGWIDNDKVNISIELSTYEAYLLNFMIDRRISTYSCVLLGHAGTGKSTLLRYIIHYVYCTESSLAEYFLPVYIALSDEFSKVENLDSYETLYNFLDEQLYHATFESVYNFLLEKKSDLNNILGWINVNSKYDEGKFPPGIISEITKIGIANYI